MNEYFKVVRNIAKKSSFLIAVFKKYKFLLISLDLKRNFRRDFCLFKNYSLALNLKSFENKEAELIIQYHGLEKGMLHEDIKPGFAKFRVERLHFLLEDSSIINSINKSQTRVCLQVLCKYYEIHERMNYDISSYYSFDKYNTYKKLLGSVYDESFEAIRSYSLEEFYANNNKSFDLFSSSRKSIRNFNGELISKDLLNKVIDLANTAPSVCNRQANKVYLLENKTLIDKVLFIQGGFSGYLENVNQLLILTNDRSAYYTVGERNQLFVDGGIYLMNLLYSLHFYKIANCPANWGKNIDEEDEFEKIIKLPKAEKIICMIPIGLPKDNVRTTLSKRRTFSENFITLN